MSFLYLHKKKSKPWIFWPQFSFFTYFLTYELAIASPILVLSNMVKIDDFWPLAHLTCGGSLGNIIKNFNRCVHVGFNYSLSPFILSFPSKRQEPQRWSQTLHAHLFYKNKISTKWIYFFSVLSYTVQGSKCCLSTCRFQVILESDR